MSKPGVGRSPHFAAREGECWEIHARGSLNGGGDAFGVLAVFPIATGGKPNASWNESYCCVGVAVFRGELDEVVE